MPRSPGIVTAFIASLVWLAGASITSAQERSDGVRVGSFVVAPKVTVATGYDDNLFRDSTGTTETFLIRIAPEVKISSDWNRHAVRIDLGGQADFFTHSRRDNFLDAYVNAAAEIDVTRRFRLQASASLQRGHDDRAADDLPLGAAEPVRYIAFEVGLGAEAEFGAIAVFPHATWRRFDYSDVALLTGGIADQDNRDRHEFEAGVEFAFALSRNWAVLVRAKAFEIDYRSPASTAGPARDARGLEATGGVRLKFSELLEASLAAGIVHQDYSSSLLADVTTLAFDVGLNWRPTRRLSLELNGRRNIVETAVTGASGRVTTDGTLVAGYELLRVLTINARANLAHDRFKGVARSDLGLSLGFGGDWSLTRILKIQPAYAFHRRISNAAGQGFSAHVFTVSATFELGGSE